MADLQSKGMLDAEQLKGAFTRLGVNLTEQEIIGLITEFGRESKIEIDELILQVGGVTSAKMRNDVKMALFKIRFLKKISIKDIRGAFSKLSSCFSLAYSYQVKRGLTLTPSMSMRPRLDPSGLFYKDFFYTNINSI